MTYSDDKSRGMLIIKEKPDKILWSIYVINSDSKAAQVRKTIYLTEKEVMYLQIFLLDGIIQILKVFV